LFTTCCCEITFRCILLVPLLDLWVDTNASEIHIIYIFRAEIFLDWSLNLSNKNRENSSLAVLMYRDSSRPGRSLCAVAST
jgi:hypothetical protein